MSPPLRAAEHLALFPGQPHSSSEERAPKPVGDAAGSGGSIPHTLGSWERGQHGGPQSGKRGGEEECAGCPPKEGTGENAEARQGIASHPGRVL